MSDDSDPSGEPTPSDGADADGTGSGSEGAPSDAGEDGSSGDGVDRRSPSADEEDGTERPTDENDAEADDGVGGDEAGDGADGPHGVDRRSPYEAGEDDPFDDDPEELTHEPQIEEVERPAEASSAAGPPAGQPTATGDGGVEGAAVSAAQKGMDAVNEGFDALGGGDGPNSDQEMPLTEHIEEMMRRLSVVFAIGAVVSLAVLFVGSVSPSVPSAAEIIRFFWDAHVGYQEYQPRVYGPLEFVLTKLKVAGLAGLLVGLPVFVHQTYLFMRPGLYPHERRYYLAAIPTSFVLGVVGAAFAHVAVLPFVFDYFIGYTQDTADIAFALSDTFNLILLMMGYFAIVFQIPLFMQLAVMMNVVSRRWMEQRRLIFWGAFLGLAFTFIAADPTGFASIIVAATMIVLFEATLVLLRWTGN